MKVDLFISDVTGHHTYYINIIKSHFVCNLYFDPGLKDSIFIKSFFFSPTDVNFLSFKDVINLPTDSSLLILNGDRFLKEFIFLLPRRNNIKFLYFKPSFRSSGIKKYFKFIFEYLCYIKGIEIFVCNANSGFEKFNSLVFKSFVDPILIDLNLKYDFSKVEAKSGILVLGSINSRKNLGLAYKLSIVLDEKLNVIGKGSFIELERLNLKDVYYVDRFISDLEFSDYLMRSKIVWFFYKNHNSSSGILPLALFFKCIVAVEFGSYLFNELIFFGFSPFKSILIEKQSVSFFKSNEPALTRYLEYRSSLNFIKSLGFEN